MSATEVELWTDGACSGNPGPGGWAALLRAGEHERVLSGGEPLTTNNRMELKSVVEGLRALNRPCRVRVHLDSSYVKNAFTNGWLARWQRNGWTTSGKQPVKNRELWQELLAEASRHDDRVGEGGRPRRRRAQRARRPPRVRRARPSGRAHERDRGASLSARRRGHGSIRKRRFGSPRVHFRLTDSTNARARELATAGAPHGTLVTAAEQTAGRGRQGRTWTAPPGRALLCSVVIRDPPRLLPLVAGVAVAESCPDGGGSDPQIKWPNDVLVDGRKVAGILVEGRVQERWAVVGIGVNVAVRATDFPRELRDRAGTLGLEPGAIEPWLGRAAARARALARRGRRTRCSRWCAPATRCSVRRCGGAVGRGSAPASTATGAWWCGPRSGRWRSMPARCTWRA